MRLRFVKNDRAGYFIFNCIKKVSCLALCCSNNRIPFAAQAHQRTHAGQERHPRLKALILCVFRRMFGGSDRNKDPLSFNVTWRVMIIIPVNADALNPLAFFSFFSIVTRRVARIGSCRIRLGLSSSSLTILFLRHGFFQSNPPVDQLACLNPFLVPCFTHCLFDLMHLLLAVSYNRICIVHKA